MSNAIAILRTKGRAVTPEDKRIIVERLLAAWSASPDERLGQFIVNATAARSKCPLFYEEDDGLCVAAEKYVKGRSK